MITCRSGLAEGEPEGPGRLTLARRTTVLTPQRSASAM